MQVTVNVTQEIIDADRELWNTTQDPDERCRTCPVATAMNQAGIKGAEVIGGGWYTKYEAYTRFGNGDVEEAIRLCDWGRHNEVQPFSFEVEVERLLTMKKGKRDGTDSTTA